jgi:periplasmic protein TonB
MTYRIASTDLHRNSPWIFLVSLGISSIVIVSFLFYPIPYSENQKKVVAPLPVIIELQNITETHQEIHASKPSKPFIPNAQPVSADKVVPPESITIPDTKLDREAVPQSPAGNPAGEKEGTDVKQTASSEDKPVNEFVPPKRINTIVPDYPEMASRAGIEGVVYLKLLVNSAGFVDSVEVQRGPKIFQRSAIEAAKATRFTPAKKNDKTLAWWVYLPFRFIIENKEK